MSIIRAILVSGRMCARLCPLSSSLKPIITRWGVSFVRVSTSHKHRSSKAEGYELVSDWVRMAGSWYEDEEMDREELVAVGEEKGTMKRIETKLTKLEKGCTASIGTVCSRV